MDKDQLAKQFFEMDNYQIYALRTALDSAKSIEYMTLGLAGEAGEVANKVKKLIRDGETYEKRLAIARELGDVLWYLAGVASMLRFNLKDIAADNLVMLKERTAKGTIKGEGDNR